MKRLLKLKIAVISQVIFLLAIIFTSCTTATGNPTTSCTNNCNVNYVITPTPNPQYRDPMIIQFCDQSTADYNRSYFQDAEALMAKSLVDAVRANQGGVIFYTDAINTDTANETSQTTLTPIMEGSTPPYPNPTAPPTPNDSNYVTKNDTATAYALEVNNLAATYTDEYAQINQQISNEKNAVTTETATLKQWNPPIDSGTESVIGCLQLAAERFQYQQGIKMIYIASDLENTNQNDNTERLTLNQELSGAIIHIIFLNSATSRDDHTKRTLWCPILQKMGASAIVFSDPNESLALMNQADLFTTESTMQTGCPGQ